MICPELRSGTTAPTRGRDRTLTVTSRPIASLHNLGEIGLNANPGRSSTTPWRVLFFGTRHLPNARPLRPIVWLLVLRRALHSRPAANVATATSHFSALACVNNSSIHSAVRFRKQWNSFSGRDHKCNTRLHMRSCMVMAKLNSALFQCRLAEHELSTRKMAIYNILKLCDSMFQKRALM